MILTGQSELTIDSKQRLAIPAKYRHQIDKPKDGDAWFCLPWERTLRLYTEAMFNRLAAAFPSTLAPGGIAAEFDRLFFGSAERLEMDTAGRLTLPKRHVEMAELTTDVMMVGARDRLEVHDRTRWERAAFGKHEGLPNLVAAMQKEGGIPVVHQAPGHGTAGESARDGRSADGG